MASVRVKICGIRTEEIMRVALEAGADEVGLVFFAKSPRTVGVREAARLAGVARGRAGVVALTVDADDASLDAIVREVGPDVLQLHGSETPQRCSTIRQRWGVPVMKAIGVATAADVALADAYDGAADRILFDAKPPKGAVLPGGNGAAFDWTILAGAAHRRRFMLSGGLGPDNVAEAIRVTRAWAVDVSSGVETAPGMKDAGLVRRFIVAAKG